MSERKARCKGFGTLERRGDHFVGRWIVGGNRHSQSIHAQSKAEARKLLDEITAPFRLKNESERLAIISARKSEVDGKIAEIESRKPKLLLSDAFEAYLESPSRPDTAGPHTLDNNRTMFSRLLKWVKSNRPEVREMRHFTSEHAMEFMSDAFRNIGNWTRNMNLSFYKKLWNTLIDDGRHGIASNPFAKIRNRKAEHFRREAFTIEQAKAILEAVRDDVEMRSLIMFALYAGLRLGDCKCIRWENVDFIGNVLRLTTEKTKANVSVPLHPELRNALLSLGAKRDGFVLASLHSLDKRSVCKRFSEVLRRAGIKALSDAENPSGRRRTVYGFHSLRHTFVSMQLNRGVPVSVVQSMVGHSSVHMTMHYSHSSREAQRSAVEAIPLFGDGGGREAEAERREAALDGVLGMIGGLTYDEKVRLLECLAAMVEKPRAA